LTDDNQPAIDELRSNAAYSACLLEIVRSGDTARGKDKEVIGDRLVMLKVLVSGKDFFGGMKYLGLIKIRYPQQCFTFASP
jgi:hypothetical protein